MHVFLYLVAGVFCAIVSHPADSVVSVLNKEKGSTATQVLKKLGPKGKTFVIYEDRNSLCFTGFLSQHAP